MKPEDDVTWPRCPAHTNSSGHAARHWCDHVRTILVEGRDAPDIEPGARYCVPIVPSLDMFAEVSIGSDLIAGISADLALVKGSDPFAMNEDLIPLGRWATGEGRLVIASVVSDWAEGHAPDKCTASRHGFPEEMTLQGRPKDDNTFWKANKWCLAYYGHCYPCQVATQMPGGVTASPVINFDASSFGVNPNEFGGGGRPRAAVSREQRTRDALRNRFQ